jgi:hypothetical protein
LQKVVIVATSLHGVTTSAAVRMFSFLNRNTVSKAKYGTKRCILFSMRYKPFDVHRSRISEEAKEHIIQFWIKNTVHQYETQLSELKDYQALVIMDFAVTYQLGYQAVESADEWFNKRSVQDCR